MRVFPCLDHINDLGLTHYRRCWQAASYHFAQAGEIGLNIIDSLSTSIGHPEAGNHLIKDEHRSIFLSKLAQPLEKARLWRYHTHIGGHRLRNNRCYLLAIRRE